MLTSPATRGPLEPARSAIRRSLLRRHLRAVVAGKGNALNLDLYDHEIDTAALIVEAAAPLEPDGAQFARLEHAMRGSGLANAVIDGHGSRDSLIKARSLRIAGAMRMEPLVPIITPLLWSADPAVRRAATRTLGTIGGLRSASALLMAIQRLGHKPMLIVALARAAPDLYLEAILSAGQPRAVLSAVALAVGLRRRRLATAALIAQLNSGPSRVRMASSRALGWIGTPAGIPALTSALEHGDWRVRMSAAKALGTIATYQPGRELQACLEDRNPRVKRAALNAIRRHARINGWPRYPG